MKTMYANIKKALKAILANYMTAMEMQIAQTLRVLFAHQGLHYEYAVGGWPNAFRFQPADHIL